MFLDFNIGYYGIIYGYYNIIRCLLNITNIF